MSHIEGLIKQVCLFNIVCNDSIFFKHILYFVVKGTLTVLIKYIGFLTQLCVFSCFLFLNQTKEVTVRPGEERKARSRKSRHDRESQKLCKANLTLSSMTECYEMLNNSLDTWSWTQAHKKKKKKKENFHVLPVPLYFAILFPGLCS